MASSVATDPVVVGLGIGFKVFITDQIYRKYPRVCVHVCLCDVCSYFIGAHCKRA